MGARRTGAAGKRGGGGAGRVGSGAGNASALGFQFGGFRLDVDGPVAHEDDDTWDANWLSVTARCESSGAAVVARCTVLTSWSIERFCEGLVGIAQHGAGCAYLAAEEPCLALQLQCASPGAGMTLRAEITPNHLDQGHWFTFPVAPADVDAAITHCRAILAAFPPHQVATHD